MLTLDAQLHLWEKGTPFSQHRRERYFVGERSPPWIELV
jgi:hypothetical protein